MQSVDHLRRSQDPLAVNVSQKLLQRMRNQIRLDDARGRAMNPSRLPMCQYWSSPPVGKSQGCSLTAAHCKNPSRGVLIDAVQASNPWPILTGSFARRRKGGVGRCHCSLILELVRSPACNLCTYSRMVPDNASMRSKAQRLFEAS